MLKHLREHGEDVLSAVIYLAVFLTSLHYMADLSDKETMAAVGSICIGALFEGAYLWTKQKAEKKK